MDKSVYQRPSGARAVTVTRRQRVERAALALPQEATFTEVCADSHCHITPPPVAARMASYLSISPWQRWLEPSAGTGELLAAALAAGALAANAVAVERFAALAAKAEKRTGIYCHACCFLDYASTPALGLFDRIIMNPPFNRWRAHVAAARALLSPGGRAIALLPMPSEVPGAITLEYLPSDTFALAKVNTKIVLIDSI